MHYSGYFSFDALHSSFLIEMCIACGCSRISFSAMMIYLTAKLRSESPFVSEVLRRGGLTTMVPLSEALNKENR